MNPRTWWTQLTRTLAKFREPLDHTPHEGCCDLPDDQRLPDEQAARIWAEVQAGIDADRAVKDALRFRLNGYVPAQRQPGERGGSAKYPPFDPRPKSMLRPVEFDTGTEAGGVPVDMVPAADEVPEFDPEQCYCAATSNPPCAYCERGEYQPW